ncbi:hypothetical protein M011DRAFT_529228 [Sporormia fimetaria CBS 119925]|uniref:Uncharacterized protein n=1 Tax=Sporormia fimetaria CBS 119925 TaxID=1340428 RepID=A0A6A6V025_9PLEO|nr:hypothetical protein M011DRAFT_529228 [Sporormia fimetaria CBS 119925]
MPFSAPASSAPSADPESAQRVPTREVFLKKAELAQEYYYVYLEIWEDDWRHEGKRFHTTRISTRNSMPVEQQEIYARLGQFFSPDAQLPSLVDQAHGYLRTMLRLCEHPIVRGYTDAQIIQRYNEVLVAEQKFIKLSDSMFKLLEQLSHAIRALRQEERRLFPRNPWMLQPNFETTPEWALCKAWVCNMPESKKFLPTSNMNPNEWVRKFVYDGAN